MARDWCRRNGLGCSHWQTISERTGKLNDFLNFNRMIAGDIIKYVFWALAGLTIIGGLLSALFALFSGDIITFLMCLVFTVLGPVIIRIYCELMIVLFKIHESLVEIKNK